MQKNLNHEAFRFIEIIMCLEVELSINEKIVICETVRKDSVFVTNEYEV